MPIATNATASEDMATAKQMITALAPEVGDEVVNVKFLKTKVKVATEDDVVDMTRPQFRAWAEAGFPWDGEPQVPDPRQQATPEPEPEPDTEAAPASPSAPTEDAEEPPETPTRTERKTADPSDVLEELATEAFEIEREELDGQHGRNVARYRRGELMLRLQSISQAAKLPVKDLLSELNRRTIALASKHQIPDFAPISEGEATMMRKVVSAFGSSGEFRHVYGIDPATGTPLVQDDGTPYEIPLTDIAPNKLYPLTQYADKLDHDELMSFAYSATEKVVKKTKGVAKAIGKPFSEVMHEVVNMRTTIMSPLGEDVGEIQVPPSEKDILAHLREVAGEKPAEDVASIKTSRAWYEGTWLPIKNLVTAIAQEFMPDRIPEGAGQVPNVLILERILTQFYNPMEDDGVKRLLAVFVAAEDMTNDQAVQFLENFAYDGENDEWVRVTAPEVPNDDEFDLDEPDGEEPKADTPEDEDDDDDFDDEDFDLDTPGDEDDDDAGEDDEDF